MSSSSYEDGRLDLPSVLAIDLKSKSVQDAVPGWSSSAGAMALGDFDGDGDLDLFVAGRVIPGRYPQAASSRLYRNNQGRFEADLENTKTFENVGLVSGVVCSDLDSDGRPDLILACEWGPVRVFKNQGGRFVDATAQLGLEKRKGWWTGVNTGDFDGDGKLDIVAANWGRNSRYEHFRQQPLRIYYGSFNGDTGVQTLECHFDPRMQQYIPWRRLDDAAKAMPFLQAKFETFEAFSAASVDQLLGDRLSNATILDANWLETTVLFNRGNGFEAKPLPLEAQLSPAFAVCVGDLDGDGCEDLFLSQNFFAVQPEMSRYDAGRSLWLRGEVMGNSKPRQDRRAGFWLMANSAAPRSATTTATAAWIWRSAKTARPQSSSITNARAPGCASGSRVRRESGRDRSGPATGVRWMDWTVARAACRLWLLLARRGGASPERAGSAHCPAGAVAVARHIFSRGCSGRTGD